MPGGAREEGGVVDRPRDVELPAELDRLAALQGLGPRELLGALGQYAREAVHRLRALAGSGTCPAREGGAGGGHGGVDVLGTCEVVREHRVAGRGVDHGVLAARSARAQLAVDVLRTGWEGDSVGGVAVFGLAASRFTASGVAHRALRSSSSI